MSDVVEAREGGCLCGAVRYRIDGAPSGVVHCHCTMCRRASGGPVMTFVNVATRNLTYTAGAPARYQSSAEAVREFCAGCGTALTFRFVAHPERVGVAASTLDRPAELAPEAHYHAGSRLPWLDMADGLPRYRGHTAAAEERV